MNEPENDVLSLLKRMQQQLGFLEKKMDTLIHQTQNQQRPQQPFRGERSWRPKPPWQHDKKKPFFGKRNPPPHR
jgi:hypothetical protein